MNYRGLKILYLTKVIPDYLHDVVYKGLTELGCVVEDYPRKMSLHGRPHPSEFHSEQILFDLPLETVGGQPDLMIVPGLWYDYNPVGPQAWANEVVRTYEKYRPKKVIVIDGADKPSYVYPAIAADYDRIFKREMNERPSDIWHHISFAATEEPFTYRYYDQRDIDVSFVATVSNDFRRKVASITREVSKECGLRSYVHLEKYHIPRQEYLDILSRSRVAVSVRGMGKDCYRYWEVPAKGTVMVTEDIDLPIQNDFTAEHCIRFKDLEGLAEILRGLSDIPNRDLERKALLALVHTAKYHTPCKRAEYVLDVTFNV